MNETDINIVLNPDGSVRLNAVNGTFEEGAAKILKLAELLRLQGVPVEVVGVPEQHREDDPTHVHTHTHSHA